MLMISVGQRLGDKCDKVNAMPDVKILVGSSKQFQRSALLSLERLESVLITDQASRSVLELIDGAVTEMICNI